MSHCKTADCQHRKRESQTVQQTYPPRANRKRGEPDGKRETDGEKGHSSFIRFATSLNLSDVWLAYNRPVTPKLTCVPPMLV